MAQESQWNKLGQMQSLAYTCMCDRECARLDHAIHTKYSHDACICPAGAFRSPATCYRNLVSVVVVRCVFLFAARFARPRTRSRDQLGRCSHRHTRFRSCAWHCMPIGRLPPSQSHYCTEWRLAKCRTHFLLLVFVQYLYGSKP
jgi:hypothetical protein